MISQTVTLAFLPVFGYFSDRLDPRVLILATVLVRAVLAGSFRFVTRPDTWFAYTMLTLLCLISNIQGVSIQVLFLRNMNPKIRGSLNGVMFLFSMTGMTVFTLVGGVIFDKVGPFAPFAFVAIFDAVVLFISIVFVMCGLISKND